MRYGLGPQDRQDLSGWVSLMNDLGVTPPGSVQRFLDGGRVDLRGRRGRPARDAVPGAPAVGPVPVSEAAYGARSTAGAMPYQDYARAAAFARLGNPQARPDLAQRYTVPTQHNGVPNVIPRGARITYPGAAEAAADFTAPPATTMPQFGAPLRNRPRRR